MPEKDTPDDEAIIAPLPGDSPFGRCTLKGRWLGRAASKVEDGTAFLVQLDGPSQDLLRLHAADPTKLLVDLEDLPASRLPGMGHYIGGAFVRFYGKHTWGHTDDEASGFNKFLGTAEVVEREDQELLEPREAAHSEAAAQVITLAKLDFNVELDLGIHSLPKAAELMSRVGVGGVEPPLLIGRLAFLWISYFGECLIREYGGRWFRDPKIGDVVMLPRGAFPEVRVSPLGVVYDILRGQDASAIHRWLSRVQLARSSTEFSGPVVK